ncbi:MAG TPA: hypothetical protein PK177_04760 [Burkholderiaceae bacterium]|nr:hypothetical protein [Burkholderiaceae bacterium]
MYLDDADSPADLPSYEELGPYRARGIRIVAPPIFALLASDGSGRIMASEYARNARRAGLEIIAWSLEHSGLIGGGARIDSVSRCLARGSAHRSHELRPDVSGFRYRGS